LVALNQLLWLVLSYIIDKNLMVDVTSKGCYNKETRQCAFLIFYLVWPCYHFLLMMRQRCSFVLSCLVMTRKRNWVVAPFSTFEFWGLYLWDFEGFKNLENIQRLRHVQTSVNTFHPIYLPSQTKPKLQIIESFCIFW